jgi:hypothetical protein
VELLQFLGTVAPNLAPSLLIAWLSIRIILEFLKERREMQEAFRAERKEWRESYDLLARDYRTSLIDVTALGRDMVNQMHALRGEITKFLLDEGRRKSGGND